MILCYGHPLVTLIVRFLHTFVLRNLRSNVNLSKQVRAISAALRCPSSLRYWST